MSFDWNNENARKERGSPKEKNTLMRGIGEAREDSERMEGWVSGRGNKRGSKSRPGPGLANKRAPAGSPLRLFEQAMTSLGASRRHLFLPRSMTRPCIPCPASSCRPRRPQPSRLNQLVPVLKGAAAVSATWQPCLYLASSPPRTLATSDLSLSIIHIPCMVDRDLSLHPFLFIHSALLALPLAQ